MNPWKLVKCKYLLGLSNNSNKMGQLTKQPRYEKTFVNVCTGEIKSVDDVTIAKQKRGNALECFLDKYFEDYKSKKLTILSIVVKQDYYATMGKFINTLTRKLKRKGIARLGYVWVRDVGNILFEKHFHLLIATSEIEKSTFRSLFNAKDHSKYEIEFLKTRTGMKNYLSTKEIFGLHKERAYSKSRKFKSITK